MNTDVGIEVVCMNKVNVEEWFARDDTLYISGDFTHINPLFEKSKWSNPYLINKLGWKGRLQAYECHILCNEELRNSLEELEGKTLGCFCRPGPCHGDILIKLYKRLVLKMNV